MPRRVGHPSGSARRTTSGTGSRRPARDHGSAVVDFVLVSALVVVLVAGILQLTLALHVRNTLVDCAGEGARHGALAGNSAADGAQRTRELIASALAPGYAGSVSARAVTVDGLGLLEVEVRAPLPILGLLGPGGMMMVTGHAVLETTGA